MRLGWMMVPVTAMILTACDDRSAEEKGHDYADEKVGFAEGAAKVLEDRGKGLGESVGKGVGELIKGTGSAVKDVAHPPVEVALDEGLAAGGMKVLDAHEGPNEGARTVIARLAFEKAWTGRFVLRAHGEDGGEIARARVDSGLTQAAGSEATLTFPFDATVRLSKIARYTLEGVPPKALELDGLAGLTASQLTEVGSAVRLYAVFEKAYKGGLQLRAHDAQGNEIGRSEPGDALQQASDSASWLTFRFDPMTPLSNAERYTLHRGKAAKKK